MDIENGKSRSAKEIIDPTANVLSLVAAAVLRLDDLRKAEMLRVDQLRDAEIRRVNEQMTLLSAHSAQLNLAEAKRIDAIRAVDVNAVSVANERASAQAQVLANQVSQSAETLRALVAQTATTVAQQLAQVSSGIAERLSALEKSSNEGIGKNLFRDPQMELLLREMKETRETMTSRGGRSEGIGAVAGWIVSGIMALIAVLGFILPRLK